MSECSWKSNWRETKEHFGAWWRGDGLVLAYDLWNATPAREPLTPPTPEWFDDAAARYTNIEWRVRANHYQLARKSALADALLISNTDIGPGSLALFIGSQPIFTDETVWFTPNLQDDPHPERQPPLHFSPENEWWQVTEATIRASAALGNGKYLIGCPDLIENVDILAALRGPQTLMVDLLDRPDWVLAKIDEINQVWFDAYSRIYDLIRLEDGSSTFGAFHLWAPGKMAKLQCDASAMFSPPMFQRFVVPALQRQCAWLDYSIYHMDGPESLRHLDLLLDIAELSAIEWTPGPQVPSGGNPTWYAFYRRILEAGKSVQAIEVRPHEVLPLLDAVGGKGMYLLVKCTSEAEIEDLLRKVEPYR